MARKHKTVNSPLNSNQEAHSSASLKSSHTRTPQALKLNEAELRLHLLLRNQDIQVLTELSKYAGRLEAILRRKFINCIPLEDIKDIVAETLIKAYQKGPEYRPELSNIMTWLNMLAHFQALKFLRDNQVFTSQALDELADCTATRIEQDTPPTNEQPSVRMETALHQLTPQRAKAIQLHYYQGLSFDQIADILGVSISGVKSLLSRARGDLRARLSTEELEASDDV